MVDIIKSKNNYAANYGQPMSYYIPEWDDRVDPNYDFINDNHTPNRDPYSDDVYAHEIYDEDIYDGILLSKINAESTEAKREKISKKGVHRFLRFPENKPIMGDCGAFSYLDEYEPPYETDEIIQYYSDLGFNYGVSIDHLIVGKYAKDEDEKLRRYKLTMDNAEDFINIYNKSDFNFIPIGIAQGWDSSSYKKSVDNLIQMGYKYIALGGLAKSKTKDIIPILEGISPIIPQYLKVHLFGVSRIETIKEFRKLGITSFDSASFLRRAWLSSSSNYMTIDDKKYAAVRIPQVDSGRKVSNLIKSGQGTKEEYKKLEKNALKSLREYDKGKISFENVYKKVIRYEEKIQEDNGILKVKKKLEKQNIEIDEVYNKLKEVLKEINRDKLLQKDIKEYDFEEAESIFKKIEILYEISQEINNEKKLKKKFNKINNLTYKEFKSLKGLFKKYHKAKLKLSRHRDKYKRVLTEKPWKECECDICQKIGIETIIFRGNNRNRRRGFHNTYVFYKQFQEMLNSMN